MRRLLALPLLAVALAVPAHASTTTPPPVCVLIPAINHAPICF